MTRLDRVLGLLERYDGLAEAALSIIDSGAYEMTGYDILVSLRKEKEILTQELVEHGCRRKY